MWTPYRDGSTGRRRTLCGDRTSGESRYQSQQADIAHDSPSHRRTNGRDTGVIAPALAMEGKRA